MHDLDIDVDWLVRITREAGTLALSWFGKTEGTLKGDDSWVTQADLAVEQQLRQAVGQVRPGDAIVGEEGGKGKLPEADVVWAIDPVDGTRVFNLGMPVWCVSVGVLYRGVPTLGAIYLPVVGDVYHTDGRNAWVNGVQLSPPDRPLEANSVLLASERTSRSLNLNFTGRVLTQGSCAAHLCFVARGSAVGAIDEAYIWDYAAAAAILRVLGVPFRYVSGAPVDFNELMDGRKVTESTIACHPRHFEALQHAYRNPR